MRRIFSGITRFFELCHLARVLLHNNKVMGKVFADFGIDKNAQKEWIEGIWEMTRVKRNNSSA